MSPDLEHQLRKATDCELRFDALTRHLFATDASLYQIEPLSVAFPSTAAQASTVIRAAADAGIPVIPRGAGTGLAGGAIGRGLVVDFARYNREITDFDLDQRTVRVGAGVVLDQLNSYLRPHGLQFGPDVATSSRATLGGMIANNSSGAHVPVYGTTADHVSDIEGVLADGTVAMIGCATAESGRGGEEAPRSGMKQPLVYLQQHAKQLVLRYAEDIRRRMPAGLPKRWPGYQFDRYLCQPDDLTQLISGSEGTLAAIWSAQLRLLPLPRRRGLGVLFFSSVADAMQASVELLDLRPAAIEHIDRLLFDQTRGQLPFRAARDLLRLDEEPCEAILLVEFFDDAQDKLELLASRRLGTRRLLLHDEARQAMVWAVRRAGLTLLTSRKGPAKPTTGIEDVAIRPEQLPEYVHSLQEVLHQLGLEASFYGHAAAGLLHVRPVIDLHGPRGVALLRQVADEVSAIVKQFRGSIAGEHGVGIARTEYLPDHLGPELMAASRELKAIFDPGNLMNPGKIVSSDDAYRIDSNLRQDAGVMIELPFAPMLGFVERDASFVGNLEQCNGNGACLKTAATMCPTYIVTHEEIMSTRGRANIIRAVLDGRLGPRGEALLSPELDEALRPCLSCKACKTECPSNVDLAQLKAELLHARQQRIGPSLLDRMVASADRLGRIGSATAWLSNAMLQSRPVRSVLEAFLGLDQRRILPLYARERFDKWFQKNRQAGNEGHRNGAAPPDGEVVVLWDDTWVRYHEPQVGIAAVRVLEAAGYDVVLPHERECCGRPAFSRGMLDASAAMGRHNIALLHEKYQDLPVVFLEPSCHSMFVDEYRQLRLPGADELARRCVSFEAFVDRAIEAGRLALPSSPQVSAQALGASGRVGIAIHAHCHTKALTDVKVLERLARRIPGADAALLDTACCGMAGAYGMLKHNYELSLQVGQPMVEKIRALPAGTQVVASGTSCRHQIRDLTGRNAFHMAEILERTL